MTPEELNRTVEFIIQSQARLAAAQEQDRQERIEFQEWSKLMHARQDRLSQELALISKQVANTFDRQSQRMDRFDKLHEDSLKQNAGFQHEALRLLHLILDRLPFNPRELT
jgi:hypothetical protein